MRALAETTPQVCIAVTLMDGLVLARSAFHHSVNYRSAVIFSRPRKVTDDQERYHSLEVFTNKIQPGRWEDVRKPTDNEWKATLVLAFALEEASAKIRTGPPKDDDEDYALPVWAGVVPLETRRLQPVPDPLLPAHIPVPEYLDR